MTLINIALVVKLFKNLLKDFFVVLVRCTNEFIVACIKAVPNALYLRRNAVYIFLGRNTGFICVFLDLLTVFVSPCQ